MHRWLLEPCEVAISEWVKTENDYKFQLVDEQIFFLTDKVFIFS